MDEGKQDEPTGALSYRITRAGEIHRLSRAQRAKAAPDLEDIKSGETYVTARLVNNELDLRVGATAIIGGERVVNREFIVHDASLLSDIKKALKVALDQTAHLAERRVMRDAEDTVRDESEPDDDVLGDNE